MIDTKYRTSEAEIMDDFLLEGEELRDALDKIAVINRMLGGNKITLHGLKKLLKAWGNKTVTIADIGCGNGDMLRTLAEYAGKENLDFRLVGIDANQFTVDYARQLSTKYRNISYQCLNIFSDEFKTVDYDIALCTLTLHHFDDKGIMDIMDVFYKNASVGVVINDLHRSKTAYRLFGLICSLFGLNRMSREDGLTSILRGFKKQELKDFSERLGFKRYEVAWRWAFRYEWIIYKT
jgi:SAM-dependent methyltransferase